MSRQIQEPLEDSFKHQKEGVLLNVAAMTRDLGQIKALLESGLFNVNGRAVQSGCHLAFTHHNSKQINSIHIK